MSKKMKQLLLAVAAVAVLGGVAAFLLLTKPTEEAPESSEAESSAMSLIAEKLEDFESLTVNNASGTITIRSKEEQVQQSDGTEATEQTFVVENVAKYKQNKNAKSFVSAFTSLNADAQVTDSEDAEKFGFDQPLATATMVCKEATFEMELGMHNEAAQQYYFRMKGDDNIYTISEANAERLLANAYSYVDLQLIEELNSATGEMPKVELVRIARPDLAKELELRPVDDTDYTTTRGYSSEYILTSPVRSEVNYHVDDDFLPKLFGMKATEVLGEYEEAKAAEYGLEEPSCVFDFRTEATDLHLTVGGVVSSDDGDTLYYALVNDDGLLYTVSADAMPFMNTVAGDLITTMPVLPNISEITQMAVTVDGKETVFTIQNEKDEESGNMETTAVFYDGEELALDNFRLYYQLMLSSKMEDINLDDNAAAPVMTIAYTYADKAVEQLDFYPIEGEPRRVQVAVNGNLIYEGRMAFIDKARTETDHVINGKTVDVDW